MRRGRGCWRPRTTTRRPERLSRTPNRLTKTQCRHPRPTAARRTPPRLPHSRTPRSWPSWRLRERVSARRRWCRQRPPTARIPSACSGGHAAAEARDRRSSPRDQHACPKVGLRFGSNCALLAFGLERLRLTAAVNVGSLTQEEEREDEASVEDSYISSARARARHRGGCSRAHRRRDNKLASCGLADQR